MLILQTEIKNKDIMVITIPINKVTLNESEIASATTYINNNLAFESERMVCGYTEGMTKVYVVGGGFGNDNGLVLHQNEAYALLDAYKSANYYCYIQWSPNGHYVRAIGVSHTMLNIDQRYFERY